MRYLVTGSAGFIGFHVARRLLAEGHEVVGVDDFSSSLYAAELKEARHQELEGRPGYTLHRGDLADAALMSGLFRQQDFDRVIHLGAQAGVRYSLTNPSAYVASNLSGFFQVLEGVRAQECPHLVYASSSSVYGLNGKTPFSVGDNVDHPISLYAASKKANELMAHTYSHLYGLPTTGLRFFTVYGPWGRPDMAVFKFTRKIDRGEPIELYNHGQLQRDFTFIDDIAEGVVRIADHPAQPNPDWDGAAPDPASSSAPYRIYNIGNQQPVALMDFVATLEAVMGKPAEKVMKPMQPGDVYTTCADTEALEREIGFAPRTPLADGLAQWYDWYQRHRDLCQRC
ncbi:MAG: NAD-dependent epimerase [Verrucomicrobiota bacterium]